MGSSRTCRLQCEADPFTPQGAARFAIDACDSGGLAGDGAGPTVAAEPPTTLSSRLPGKLLVESGRGRAFDTHLIELASGRSQILPRSPAGEVQSSADV